MIFTFILVDATSTVREGGMRGLSLAVFLVMLLAVHFANAAQAAGGYVVYKYSTTICMDGNCSTGYILVKLDTESYQVEVLEVGGDGIARKNLEEYQAMIQTIKVATIREGVISLPASAITIHVDPSIFQEAEDVFGKLKAEGTEYLEKIAEESTSKEAINLVKVFAVLLGEAPLSSAANEIYDIKDVWVSFGLTTNRYVFSAQWVIETRKTPEQVNPDRVHTYAAESIFSQDGWLLKRIQRTEDVSSGTTIRTEVTVELIDTNLEQLKSLLEEKHTITLARTQVPASETAPETSQTTSAAPSLPKATATTETAETTQTSRILAFAGVAVGVILAAYILLRRTS
jgi:hypothetical protein